MLDITAGVLLASVEALILYFTIKLLQWARIIDPWTDYLNRMIGDDK